MLVLHKLKYNSEKGIHPIIKILFVNCTGILSYVKMCSILFIYQCSWRCLHAILHIMPTRCRHYYVFEKMPTLIFFPRYLVGTQIGTIRGMFLKNKIEQVFSSIKPLSNGGLHSAPPCKGPYSSKKHTASPRALPYT